MGHRIKTSKEHVTPNEACEASLNAEKQIYDIVLHKSSLFSPRDSYRVQRLNFAKLEIDFVFKPEK